MYVNQSVFTSFPLVKHFQREFRGGVTNSITVEESNLNIFSMIEDEDFVGYGNLQSFTYTALGWDWFILAQYKDTI